MASELRYALMAHIDEDPILKALWDNTVQWGELDCLLPPSPPLEIAEEGEEGTEVAEAAEEAADACVGADTPALSPRNTSDNSDVEVLTTHEHTPKRGSTIYNDAFPSSTLLIRNLPFGIAKSRLMDIFWTHGDIVSITIPLDTESGCTRGFAFVEYDSAFSAARALDHYEDNELILDTKTISIEYARNQRREVKPTPAPTLLPPPPNVTTLVIRNLPRDITHKKLYDTFSSFSGLGNITLPLDHTTQNPRGFAFIAFKNTSDCISAYMATFSVLSFNGRSTLIEYVDPSSSKATATQPRKPSSPTSDGWQTVSKRSNYPARR